MIKLGRKTGFLPNQKIRKNPVSEPKIKLVALSLNEKPGFLTPCA